MIFTHGMNRKRAAGRAFSKVSASDGACSAPRPSWPRRTLSASHYFDPTRHATGTGFPGRDPRPSYC